MERKWKKCKPVFYCSTKLESVKNSIRHIWLSVCSFWMYVQKTILLHRLRYFGNQIFVRVLIEISLTAISLSLNPSYVLLIPSQLNYRTGYRCNVIREHMIHKELWSLLLHICIFRVPSAAFFDIFSTMKTALLCFAWRMFFKSSFFTIYLWLVIH